MFQAVPNAPSDALQFVTSQRIKQTKQNKINKQPNIIDTLI